MFQEWHKSEWWVVGYHHQNCLHRSRHIRGSHKSQLCKLLLIILIFFVVHTFVSKYIFTWKSCIHMCWMANLKWWRDIPTPRCSCCGQYHHFRQSSMPQHLYLVLILSFTRLCKNDPSGNFKIYADIRGLYACPLLSYLLLCSFVFRLHSGVFTTPDPWHQIFPFAAAQERVDGHKWCGQCIKWVYCGCCDPSTRWAYNVHRYSTGSPNSAVSATARSNPIIHGRATLKEIRRKLRKIHTTSALSSIKCELPSHVIWGQSKYFGGKWSQVALKYRTISFQFKILLNIWISEFNLATLYLPWWWWVP